MSDPNAPEPSSEADLFSGLPTAPAQQPVRPVSGAVPGSRRAAREARASGEGKTAADVSAESIAEPGAGARSDGNGGGLEDLFQAEAEERPVRKRRGKGCLVWLIILVLVLGGVAAGGAWVWNVYGDRISDAMGWGEPKDWEPGQAGDEVFVTIAQGDTGLPVSRALHEAGVTRTDRVFYDMLIKEQLNPVFYPGVYRLQEQMTSADALAALEDPANKLENSVGVREGATLASALPTIEEALEIPLADLEAAVADPSVYGVEADTLEGWLFPAVYNFDPDADAKDVITAMVQRTRSSLERAGVPDEDADRILTIASIIQREGRTDDFDKVSRVIYNRLDDGMKLQMDSTAQFGYGELHAGKVGTSKEAQFDDNPWNTYVIEGLPIGPISTASDAAIEAAMHPADGPWFYFVTINPHTGETVFTETYAEHLKAVELWGQWCRATPESGCRG